METKWEIDKKQIHEIRCKTTCFFGPGAIHKMDQICKDLVARGLTKVLVVSSKTAYKVCGAWGPVEKAFKDNKIEYCVYDGCTPNPTVEQVDEAAKMGIKFGAKCIVGIGGGSPLDAAKATAVLLANPDKNATDLMTYKFTYSTAVPLVVINTTHGTGTEVDRFAVVSIVKDNYKPLIAHDAIYPLYSIDDPNLMKKLSKEQTLYTSIDALNHAFEASTTNIGSAYSILLSKEAIRLIAIYLPKAVKDPNDDEARYWLLYASAIAGISFDCSLLHLTHALEHPLSGLKPDLYHGLGLAMLLPAVVKEVYAEKANIIKDILEPICPGLKGTKDEAEKCAKMVEQWLFSLGVTQKLSDMGFEDKVDELTRLAFETPSLGVCLGCSPVKATKELVKRVYTNSLKKMH